MDPVSIIATALLSAAAAKAAGTMSSGLVSAYKGLKSRLQSRFKGNQAAELALAESESDPDTWQKPLTRAISEHGLDKEQELLALAQKLLELVKAEAPDTAAKYNITISGDAQGTVIGDNAQVTQHFGDRPGKQPD